MKITTTGKPRPAAMLLLHLIFAILAAGVFIGVYYLEPLYYRYFGFTAFVILITVTSFVISILLYLSERLLAKHRLTTPLLFTSCTIVLPLVLSLVLVVLVLCSDKRFAPVYLPANLFFPQLTYIFMIVYRLVYYLFSLLGKHNEKRGGKSG